MNDEDIKYSLSQSIRLYKLDSSVALFDEKYSNTHLLDSSIECLLEVLKHDSLSLDELLKRFSDTDDVFRIGLAESLSKLPTSWTISPCLPLRRGLALLASTQTQPSVSSCLAATAGWVF